MKLNKQLLHIYLLFTTFLTIGFTLFLKHSFKLNSIRFPQCASPSLYSVIFWFHPNPIAFYPPLSLSPFIFPISLILVLLFNFDTYLLQLFFPNCFSPRYYILISALPCAYFSSCIAFKRLHKENAPSSRVRNSVPLLYETTYNPAYFNPLSIEKLSVIQTFLSFFFTLSFSLFSSLPLSVFIIYLPLSRSFSFSFSLVIHILIFLCLSFPFLLHFYLDFFSHLPFIFFSVSLYPSLSLSSFIIFSLTHAFFFIYFSLYLSFHLYSYLFSFPSLPLFPLFSSFSPF